MGIDFLLKDNHQADIVVGNPPYIRYEQIPEQQRTLYKQKFCTFHYRPDLYILFYEKGLSLLKPDGKLCFITPNRWLRNEYGKKLRCVVAQRFRLRAYYDMEQTQPFQERVLAYPCVTVIANKQQNDTQTFSYHTVNNIQQLKSPMNKGKDISIPVSEDWSYMFVQHSSDTATIEELGFTIGIGVATGANNIFISHHFPSDVEDKLLLPVISSQDLRGNTINWSGQKLLNPFTPKGQLIHLADYPGAHSYLLQHRETLCKRHIAKKNPDKWYKTIDRIKQSVLTECKLLLPEMSANNWLLIDEGQFYPLHNIYYVTGWSVKALRVLAAILMSSEIRMQLQHLAISMNGGYIQWQSQYLRKLRIPRYCFENNNVFKALEQDYKDKNLSSINGIVSKAYQRTENITNTNFRIPHQQQSRGIIHNK